MGGIKNKVLGSRLEVLADGWIFYSGRAFDTSRCAYGIILGMKSNLLASLFGIDPSASLRMTEGDLSTELAPYLIRGSEMTGSSTSLGMKSGSATEIDWVPAFARMTRGAGMTRNNRSFGFAQDDGVAV